MFWVSLIGVCVVIDCVGLQFWLSGFLFYVAGWFALVCVV